MNRCRRHPSTPKDPPQVQQRMPRPSKIVPASSARACSPRFDINREVTPAPVASISAMRTIYRPPTPVVVVSRADTP